MAKFLGRIYNVFLYSIAFTIIPFAALVYLYLFSYLAHNTFIRGTIFLILIVIARLVLLLFDEIRIHREGEPIEETEEFEGEDGGFWWYTFLFIGTPLIFAFFYFDGFTSDFFYSFVTLSYIFLVRISLLIYDLLKESTQKTIKISRKLFERDKSDVRI